MRKAKCHSNPCVRNQRVKTTCPSKVLGFLRSRSAHFGQPRWSEHFFHESAFSRGCEVAMQSLAVHETSAASLEQFSRSSIEASCGQSDHRDYLTCISFDPTPHGVPDLERSIAKQSISLVHGLGPKTWSLGLPVDPGTFSWSFWKNSR